MPQMFPMNWWLLSMMPLIMISINIMNLHFNKKNKAPNLMTKSSTMNKNNLITMIWKW